jgi:hypothetical protein
VTTYLIGYRPSKKEPKRPWVVLIDAHPKPLTAARYDSQDEAWDGAGRIAKKGDVIVRQR